MPIPTQFFRDVEKAVQKGLSLDEIEEVVLKPMKLGTELMSALWLYAWGLRQRRARGRGGASGTLRDPSDQDES